MKIVRFFFVLSFAFFLIKGAELLSIKSLVEDGESFSLEELQILEQKKRWV